MLELMIGIDVVSLEQFRQLFATACDKAGVSEESLPDDQFNKIVEDVFDELIEIQK